MKQNKSAIWIVGAIFVVAVVGVAVYFGNPKLQQGSITRPAEKSQVDLRIENILGTIPYRDGGYGVNVRVNTSGCVDLSIPVEHILSISNRYWQTIPRNQIIMMSNAGRLCNSTDNINFKILQSAIVGTSTWNITASMDSNNQIRETDERNNRMAKSFIFYPGRGFFDEQ